MKLVALSGGADSVALLLMMKEQGQPIEAVHCNFHLRGAESDRDEQFCIELCDREGIKLHRVHFVTREYAALHKMSIEMAARELRYRYFDQLRKDLDADAILVAHHRDDSVETVLQNLVRGTGIAGLTGISSRNGYIERPLLNMSRKEILEFLAKRNQTYVTDSTNLSAEEATRNKIRLDVIPLLESINPSVKESIDKTAKRLSSLIPLIEEGLKRNVEDCRRPCRNESYDCYDISTILSCNAPEYTLFYILRNYGFSSKQIEDIFRNLQSPTGSLFENACYQAVIDRGQLLVGKKCDEFVPKNIPMPGKYDFGSCKLDVSTEKIIGDFVVPKSNELIVLDAKKLKWPLRLRTVREGDKIKPFGMKGTKLVSDLLTDLKVSKLERQTQLVLTDKDEKILWVVNKRCAEGYRVTDKTSEVCKIAFYETKGN